MNQKRYIALLALSKGFKLTFRPIIWVPGHRNIFGNEKADELAKLGASLDESEPESICPLGTIQRELYVHFEQIAQSIWNTRTIEIDE